MKIAGFDIGGANTDLAIVDFNENGEIKDISVDFEYLPMWSKKEELSKTLINLTEKTDNINNLDGIGISMTAELVDAYKTKKEGVLDIINKVRDTFDLSIAFISTKGVYSFSQAKLKPLDLAAANWVGTSQLVSKIAKNCIFVDTGSTTTDIIPIKNGKEVAKGKSDYERLATGELVYTGTLRTNLVSFLDKIVLNNKEYNLASELFASTADVFNVLGLLNEEDFSCSTADGCGKSKIDSMRRIARVLCADMDMINESEIIEVAQYIYKKQIEQIAKSIKKVSLNENLNLVVVTGLGGELLAKSAAKLLEMECISMRDYFTDDECVVAPAIGTAILMENYLKSSIF
ncbi:hydantoinase/oxoprolinase family protein [Methanobrevibacter curvatus]|uniref:Hydantoinase/oxoprolinase n=1 Tax=Methanobrevibacter curvatus TaxID=49547 RepID=A0A166ES29_9EURY|nr:hydantoinase/oxoprolinase family protein [Methanobrevibacter curvatus]KZX16946.1 hydantoinase/oxoprolinase [Methanobrevibacter curvatus]